MQLDTGSRYYKSLVDGMISNFKRSIIKSSEIDYSLANATTAMIKPISIVLKSPSDGKEQQRISIQDIQIKGVSNPKVSNVYVNSKNVKLHVVFTYKTIRVFGRCVSSNSNLQKRQLSTPQQGSATGTAVGGSNANNNKVLLEATNWNSSWSANMLHMIGRDNFDMSRVYSTHTQQRLSLNLKECPQSLHEELKQALLDRVKTMIDDRQVEIMERIMLKTDTSGGDETSASTGYGDDNKSPVAAREKRSSASILPGGASQPKGSIDNAKGGTSPREENPITAQPSLGDGAAASKSKSRLHKANNNRPQVSLTRDGKRILSRKKRQTPCQQGEELDDYVDQLFRFGQRLIGAMEPVSVPNATIELPDYNLKIFLYDGKGTRLNKFRRTKPAWVFCSNETISLGLTIEVEELRVAYKYRVISGNRLLFDGDLEARLSPKIQAQFSQAVQEEDSDDPVQQRIDRIRVFRLGRVHVVIRGLGNLTQSLSMIINGYLNDNQEELQPTFRMVEGDAVRLANRMLANVNVGLLSVV